MAYLCRGLLLLLLISCGGEEVFEPVVDDLAVLVRDEYLSQQSCERIADLQLSAELKISGVLGKCRIKVQEDGIAYSLCDQVPGKEQRDFTLTYFLTEGKREIRLASVTAQLDLTNETRDMVSLDFTRGERSDMDNDNDGLSNTEEACMGRNPTDPNG